MSATPTATGITVFCGSSPGNSPLYTQAAQQVAAAIARERQGGEPVELIYGGGTHGVMGIVREAGLRAGGQVRGIIPAAFLSAEAPEGRIMEEHEIEDVVGSMHERKKRMADLSQAFIGLPGGYGTAEEVFEMTTWSQIGVHLKPVILLNVNNFYSPLREFINNAISCGFISEANRNFLTFVDGPPAAPSEVATINSSHTPTAIDAARTDEKDFDWGVAALQAIRDWQKEGSGGATPYSFEWSEEQKKGKEVL
ncbi:hypothetical protein JCM11641_004679 [Rhodosporidiobolus odoratus]